MALFDFIRNKRARAEPQVRNGEINDWFLTDCLPDNLKAKGYMRLSDCPDIRIGLDRISEIISVATIYLMENGENGDIRVRNELSKKIDISPYKYMTRQNWVAWIVKSLLLHGNAVLYPKFEDGILDGMKPINFNEITTIADAKNDYKMMIGGKWHYYDELIHIKVNPLDDMPWLGESYKVTLKDISRNLKQSGHTVNEFLSNRVIPNLIVKVDAMTDELTNEDGRARVYDKFLSASRSGEPWIIPAGLIDVEQVKPLTLNDIAIKDTIELDKRSVAAILGIPAFLLGVGEYNQDEYNNFIKTRIEVIATAIEQELTKKILYSPNLYFKFNRRTLYSYRLEEITSVYMELFTRGVVDGNEVRDVIDLSPRKELNDLMVLENYIPLDKIGDQKKLGGDESGEKAD